MEKQDIVGAIIVAIVIIMASLVHAGRVNGQAAPDTNNIAALVQE